MQCARCGGKGTVFGEGTASIPCPNCGGSGQVFPIGDSERGCYHHAMTWPSSPVDGPYWSYQPVKTLLDEYAIAAMQGICANVPLEQFAQDVLDKKYDNDDQTDAYAFVAYEYAAAMLREKMRRDEMGNVKEKEVSK